VTSYRVLFTDVWGDDHTVYVTAGTPDEAITAAKNQHGNFIDYSKGMAVG